MMDISALQELLNSNSSALADAMAAYFNGSANATEAFKMLDPETAAMLASLLNGTDLSAYIGTSSLGGLMGSGSSDGMANLTTPAPEPFSMPPLPRPGIFDAPSNPYLDGLDEMLAQLMTGLTPEQQKQTGMLLYNEMIDAAKKKAFEITMLLLLGFALVFIFSAVLIIHIRYNRHLATKGDSAAARKIVLPAFEPMLWTYCCILVGYIAFFSATIRADFMTVQSTFVTIEFAYACKQIVYLLVPIYMLQKSVSIPALVRAIGITVLASFYTVPICWLMQDYGSDAHGRWWYWILWISRWLTFIPTIYLSLWPPARSSPRAFREFLGFYVVVQALYFTACEVFRQGGSIDLGTRFGWASACWVGVYPLVIWRFIKGDTEHWRGIGKRAVELQTLFRRKGLVEERISAKGLHVLIEMHRKLIIDFANLDIQHKIAEGSNSIVFRGRLNSKETAVAIKVYTPSKVSEDVVAEYSHEAALCGALTHPNILKFYGMCVCPPSVCLVSELCLGSLEDVTMAAARTQQRTRQQALLNVAYMLDAARAVAYIHSFTPAFLHRDIKPANFLVDANGVVKLTDFGESRSIPRSAMVHNVHTNNPGLVHTNHSGFFVDTNSSSGGHGIFATLTEKLGSGAQLQRVVGTSEWKDPSENNPTHMTIKGTIDYMAPELINGKGGEAAYGEAADVYALGVTLWDILYPGKEKYPSTNGHHLKIYEAVSSGVRPALDDALHPSLRTLIESAWHSDPRLRSSAQNIVNILESVQEECGAVLAETLLDKLKTHKLLNYNHREELVVFEAERAIELMELNQYVDHAGEALRLGNALMDAGLMHHIAHAHPFENSQESYFFEENNIALCQPIDSGASSVRAPSTTTRPVGRSRATSSRKGAPTSPSSAHGSSSKYESEHLLNNGLCACRKLSQYLCEPKRTKKHRRPFQRNKVKPFNGAKQTTSGLSTLRAELRSKLISSHAKLEQDEVDDFADFVDEDIPRLSGVKESDGYDSDGGENGAAIHVRIQ